MSKISRFVIWICSKFARCELKQLIFSFLNILNHQNPAIKTNDDFKNKHYSYRDFYANSLPTLTELAIKKFLTPYQRL